MLHPQSTIYSLNLLICISRIFFLQKLKMTWITSGALLIFFRTIMIPFDVWCRKEGGHPPLNCSAKYAYFSLYFDVTKSILNHQLVRLTFWLSSLSKTIWFNHFISKGYISGLLWDGHGIKGAADFHIQILNFLNFSWLAKPEMPYDRCHPHKIFGSS